LEIHRNTVEISGNGRKKIVQKECKNTRSRNSKFFILIFFEVSDVFQFISKYLHVFQLSRREIGDCH